MSGPLLSCCLEREFRTTTTYYFSEVHPIQLGSFATMISLSRSIYLPAQLHKFGVRLLRTSSIVSSERFKGEVKPPPDTDEGKKFSPSDYKHSAGYGIPREGHDYFDRNLQLKRPLSPHLTIYQSQLPMMMSGTHRASGFMLSIGLGLTSLGILMAPQHFDHYVELIRSWHVNEYFIYATKFTAAWLMTYHFFNGIRHLAWDIGKGFALTDLYRSGYTVLALSVLSALYLAMK